MDAATRAVVSSIGGLTLSAKLSPEQRKAHTQPARDGRRQKYLTLADPDGVLDQAERERRADLLLRADMKRLALKSAAARRRARQLTAAAESADAELAEMGGAAA